MVRTLWWHLDLQLLGQVSLSEHTDTNESNTDISNMINYSDHFYYYYLYYYIYIIIILYYIITIYIIRVKESFRQRQDPADQVNQASVAVSQNNINRHTLTKLNCLDDRVASSESKTAEKNM